MTARSSLGKLALLAWLVTGCATLAPVSREPIAPDAQRALALLETRWREFSGLRTLAEISIERGGERQQLQSVVLAKAPASVRFEALSPLGQPLLLATISEGRLTAYDTTTNEAYVGDATAAATARLLGLPFDPDDLVAVLSGHALPPSDVRTATMKATDALGPSIELAGKKQRRRIWLDLESGVVRQLEVSGARGVRVTYLRNGDGMMDGFDVNTALSMLKASVRYRNPQFGTDVAQDLFTFAVPKGAKVQHIR